MLPTGGSISAIAKSYVSFNLNNDRIRRFHPRAVRVFHINTRIFCNSWQSHRNSAAAGFLQLSQLSREESQVGLVCVFPENTPKRTQNFFFDDSPGEPRAVRRRVEGGARPRLGYLSLQSGGRSRYLENTFWATVDEEVRPCNCVSL